MLKGKFKRRFLFSSLGAVISLAPVATVLACDDGTNLDYDLVNLNADIKTEMVKDYVLSVYHNRLLNRILALPETTDWSDWTVVTSHADVKSILDFFVRQNVYKDHSYLRTLKGKLLELNNPVTGRKFSAQEANAFGFDTYIANDGALHFDDAKLTALEEVVYKQNVNFFRNEFAKFLVSVKYLQISRTNWRAVFQNTDNNANFETISDQRETLLGEDHYVLGLRALRLKLFYSWTFELSVEDSLAFVTKNKMLEADVNASLVDQASPVSLFNALNSVDQKKVIPAILVDQTTSAAHSALAANEHIPGFAGITSRQSAASGSLSFSNDEVRKVTDAASYQKAYTGFLAEDGNMFDATQPDAKLNIFSTSGESKVSITKLVGIMPMFVNNELTMNGVIDPQLFAELVFFDNPKDAYEEAIKYYTSKFNPEFSGGIRLTFADLPNESFRTKIVSDVFGLGELIDKPSN